jgi:hypothetical protein
MITADTVVVGVGPRINNIKFGEVLLAASSPALADSYQIYDAIVRERVDPAFLLAIFGHESAFGKVGLAVANNNPGNTRSSILGNGTVVDTPKGKFVKYPSWFEGFKDLAARLIEPDYVYGRNGYTTIGQIIPVFAPASDGNDPGGYINAVVKSMNSWIGSNSMTAVPGPADIGYPVRIHWASDTGPDRELNTVNTFIVHDTEGYFANDEPYLAAATAPVASCHALIAPDGTLVYMVPLTTTAWTPGNPAVAEKSINVEMSGFQTKPYTDAQYRSVAAFFNWCVAQGCPIPATYVGKSGTAGIIGHQDVPDPYRPGKFGGASGHTDPGPLFDWGKLTAYISEGRKSGFDPNPGKFNVGPGVLEVLAGEHMTAITNEDYFTANSKQMGERSFTYVQDKSGATYQVEAIQGVDGNGNPTGPWKRELWKLVKEYD